MPGCRITRLSAGAPANVDVSPKLKTISLRGAATFQPGMNPSFLAPAAQNRRDHYPHRYGAARLSGLSLRPRNFRGGEFTKRGTKRSFARAAFADAENARTCRM